MKKSTLDPRTLEGEKYYVYPWVLFVFLQGPLILFLVGAMFLDFEGHKAAAIIFLILFVLWAVITVVVFFRIRECVCVLAEDRLYFFDCNVSTVGKTQYHASGYVLLSAIKEMVNVSVPRGIGYDIVRGVDFEVVLNGTGMRLIRAARKRNPSIRKRCCCDGNRALRDTVESSDDHMPVSTSIFFVP